MSKVKKLKEMKIDGAKLEQRVVAMLASTDTDVAKQAEPAPTWSWVPELRYLVKREPTFWKRGIKVLQYYNGGEWRDVPKVRTV